MHVRSSLLAALIAAVQDLAAARLILDAAKQTSDPVAVRAALDEVGWALEDLAVVEIVEAYAAQALATLDDLGLTDGDAGVDPRVNAAGGALALGHPWGASAAVAGLGGVGLAALLRA